MPSMCHRPRMTYIFLLLLPCTNANAWRGASRIDGHTTQRGVAMTTWVVGMVVVVEVMVGDGWWSWVVVVRGVGWGVGEWVGGWW